MQKITNEQVQELVAAGFRPSQIADKLGVSRSAISKVFARNRSVGEAAHDLVVRTAQKVRDSKVDAMREILLLNKLAHRELSFLSKALTATDIKDRAGLEKRQLAYIQELRQQLALALQMAQSLYGIEEVAEFQRIVLEEIETVDPAIRERIMQRLKDRRTSKGLLKG